MDIKNLILGLASNDDRIRAVLLNGSRSNPKIRPDKYQDYDIVFIVDKMERFLADHHWTAIFGEKLIFQLPGEMTFGGDIESGDRSFGFTYLMLFKAGYRIDLTLFPIQKFKTDFKPDGLTVVWLDKDILFPTIQSPNDGDYHIQKPLEKEFLDTCNEFWWVSTYVSKGLLRNEITYAKEMLETVVRPMLMKMIEWKIGIENDFLVSFGVAGRYMAKYLEKDLYEKILRTYANSEVAENWKSLFVMAEIFVEISKEVAEKLNFGIDQQERDNTRQYLREQYDSQKDGNRLGTTSGLC